LNTIPVIEHLLSEFESLMDKIHKIEAESITQESNSMLSKLTRLSASMKEELKKDMISLVQLQNACPVKGCDLCQQRAKLVRRIVEVL